MANAHTGLGYVVVWEADSNVCTVPHKLVEWSKLLKDVANLLKKVLAIGNIV
jgi:hypothetical protein